jgi:rhomboid protease GluP
MWGFGPVLTRLGRDFGFTPLVMGGCVVLYIVTLIADPRAIAASGLSLFGFLSPSFNSLHLFGASGYIPVLEEGRWWTILTAGWLHGGILHIGFNMMSLRSLAPPVAEFYGANRMIIIYTVAGAAGFTASTFGGAYLGFIPGLGSTGFTVGASASLCGLLGALMYYGRRAGSSMVSEQAKSWAIGLVVLGFLIPGIDNWAHLGGFAGGYICARILDPLKAERLDHFLAAIACLALTALAIAFSVIDGWRLFHI